MADTGRSDPETMWLLGSLVARLVTNTEAQNWTQLKLMLDNRTRTGFIDAAREMGAQIRSEEDGSATGEETIRVIARDASLHLVPEGWLLLEHGFDQGSAVRALLQAAGMSEVVTERDMEGRDRVTLGRMD